MVYKPIQAAYKIARGLHVFDYRSLSTCWWMMKKGGCNLMALWIVIQPFFGYFVSAETPVIL